MKKNHLVIFLLVVGLLCLFNMSAYAGQKIVDLRLDSNLIDSIGNLTGGALLRTSEATYIDVGGVLKTAGANEPRFESDGLLVEGESTNLFLQSVDLANVAWSTTNVTAVMDEIGPDGVANSAATVTDDATQKFAHFYQVMNTLTDATLYTLSVYVKEGTSSAFTLHINDTTVSAQRLYTNFEWVGGNLTIKSEVVGTAYIEEVGNGWWKAIAISGSAIVGANDNRINLRATENNVQPASPETTIFYGPQFEELSYDTSYIPTTAAAATRTSEASGGGFGYSWTMSATLKNILDNTLPGGGATPAIGTLIIEWKAAQDYDAVDTGARGFISIKNGKASILYFHATEGYLSTTDETAFPNIQVNKSRGDNMVSVVRWDDTADGGSGYLHISNKKNATWDVATDVNQRKAFDGAFILGTGLELNYSNELPIHINRIQIYDDWITDAGVADEVWDKTDSMFPAMPLWLESAATVPYQ